MPGANHYTEDEMAKKKTAGKATNKSQAIRDFKASNPEAGPTEIVTELGKQGLVVTTGMDSTGLSTAKKKNAKKKPGRPKGAVTAGAPKRKGRPKKKGRKKGGRPKASSNGSEVNLNALIAAKKLVDQMGGNLAQAKSALDALAKLQ